MKKIIVFMLVLIGCLSLRANTPIEREWIDCKTLTIEGQGWKEVDYYFSRLPQHAYEHVRAPVWKLAQQNSGILYRFKTNSKSLEIKWKLNSKNLAMPHTPASMVSGIDLYGKLDGRWVYVRSKVYPKSLECIASFYVSQYSEFMLYLPLYNGVESLEIGIENGSTITDNYQKRKQVVFYGSSITQGASASRPGMSYTAITGRKLDVEVINLGFSGNGRMEPELSDLLCELNPDLFVIDSLWNISADQAKVLYEPFIRKLVEKFPNTPMLLAEDCNVSNLPTEKGKVAYAVYEKLVKEGAKNLYFLPNTNMEGTDGEATVDGTHPTDLGMMRMSEVFAPKIEEILKKY